MHYYFIDTKNKALVFQRELSEEEFGELYKHICKISSMRLNNDRIQSVIQEYDEFLLLLDNLDKAKSFYDYKKLQTTLSNYLFYFKKYVDNWETYLSRTYGKKSLEVQRFKQAQAEEYDNYMEYRIMYRLRNFDQHCGNIISSISNGIDENGTKKHIVYTQRDRLLEQFDEWKAEEVDFLKKQDEQIDILPYVVKFQQSIIRIHEKIMQIHFTEDFFNSCAEIIIAANEFENEEDISIVSNECEMNSDFWNSPNQKKMNLTDLDVKACKELLKMHIRNNLFLVKVLYHGERFDKPLKSCAIPVDTKTVHKVSSTESITVNGQHTIRVFMTFSFDAEEMCAVLVDSRFKFKEIRQIEENYSTYIKALCKRF